MQNHSVTKGVSTLTFFNKTRNTNIEEFRKKLKDIKKKKQKNLSQTFSFVQQIAKQN